MTPRRWTGTEEPKTRADLLDAAARLLAEEGYSAVTSRRVAARAGVNPALVNYYFGTMDDLLVAMFRRGADAYLDRLRQALASPQPLRELWSISTEPHGMAEYLALANHHEPIRAEIAAYTTQVRTIQADALASIFRAHGIDSRSFPPWATMMLIESISRLLLIDSSLGVTIGHDELTAFVEQYLRRFEPPGQATGQPALDPFMELGRMHHFDLLYHPGVWLATECAPDPPNLLRSCPAAEVISPSQINRHRLKGNHRVCSRGRWSGAAAGAGLI